MPLPLPRQPEAFEEEVVGEGEDEGASSIGEGSEGGGDGDGVDWTSIQATLAQLNLELGGL
jgi:hypothetical protein